MKNLFLALVLGALSAFGFELENEAMRIVFGSEANGLAVESIEAKDVSDTRFVLTDGSKSDLFSLVFRREKDGAIFRVGNRAKAVKRRIEKTATGARFIFEGVSIYDEQGVLDVVCEVKMTDRTSEWTLDSANRSKRYALYQTEYPMLRGVVPNGGGNVLIPHKNRGGRLVKDCDFGARKDVDRRHGYPGCRMQVSAFHRGGAGLYFAAHDGEARSKTICFAPGNDVWFETPVEGSGHMGLAAGGPKFSVVISCYKGDWWKAAHLYRSWALEQQWCAKGKIAQRKDYPKKAAETHLWVIGGGKAHSASNMLARMDKLWPGVGKCMEWSEMSEKVKNQFDPESYYIRPGVAEVAEFGKKLGILVMFYVNGRIWDTNLVSFAYAKNDACVRIDGTYPIEKYADVGFAVMCPSRPTWREILVKKSVESLDRYNATAVYLDQISCSRPPDGVCHNPAHGHTLGGGTWWEEGCRKTLEEIRGEFAKRGAVITSEQMGETWIDLIDHFLDASGPRTSEDVPLFAAVYSGYALSHGNRIPDDVDGRTAFLENFRNVLSGEALGWIGCWTVLFDKHLERAKLLYRVALAREAAKDFLVYGTLENELRAEKADPDVIGTWWRNATDDAVALAVVNAADTEKTVRTALPRRIVALGARKIESEMKCSVKCSGGKLEVTLPPRTFALLVRGEKTR